VAVSVNPGPAAPADQTFNDLLASVIVCPPNSRTGCVTINNVLVDTGSEGLRLMKSVLTSAGLSLTPLADPNNAANSIHECLPFAAGYSWGAVAMAGVQIGGESVASIPVQVIDDSASPSPAAPGSCTSNGMALNSVNAFDANGVLGVGVLVQDCDPVSCLAATNYYYSCSSGGSCSATTLAAADEVANPVASFATDNNGVIVQLQALPAAGTGATTATGTLTFGIGTESNNMLGGSVSILTTSALGYFTTTPSGQTSLANSFIDSGSNALFFPSNSLTTCTPPPTGIDAFYCPGNSAALNLTTLSATNQGANGTISNVQFNIANLAYLNNNFGSNFALDDVGGPAGAFHNVSNYFDWGLPFFYGKTIYFAIEGKAAGSTNGPYYAY